MDTIWTKNRYDLYEVASALQKAIRRGDAKLAGFMALELFPKFSGYCWKRLLTVSAEDCDGVITHEIVALHEGFQVINKGKAPDEHKGRIFISKAVILLCKVAKNRDSDILQNMVVDRKIGITDDEIEKLIDEARVDRPKMPDYVFDCHTMAGKRKGQTKADFFVAEQKGLVNATPSQFQAEFDFGVKVMAREFMR